MAPLAHGTNASVVDHVKSLCGFEDDSTMAKYFKQQGWSSLHHIVIVDINEIKDFEVTKDDRSFEARPMAHHQRMLKAFLC